MINKKLATLLAAGALVMSAGQSWANSITVNQLGAALHAGGSDWTYQLEYSNSEIRPGDFVTLNDFGSAILETAPSSFGANWVFSQSNSGPNSLAASDNPGVLNVTLTWAGPTTQVAIATETFVLHSPIASVSGVFRDYTTKDHVQSGLNAGTVSRVIGETLVPQAVPTPDGGATAMLLGLGVLGLAGIRRKLS